MKRLLPLFAVFALTACVTPFEAPIPSPNGITAPFAEVEVTRFSFDEVQEAELTEDDFSHASRFVDGYAVRIPAGEEVAIYASSDEIDTVMFVLLPDGMELENDDSFDYELPGFLDSAVTLPVQDESIVVSVYVTSFDESSVGPYILAAVPADTLTPFDDEFGFDPMESETDPGLIEPLDFDFGGFVDVSELELPAATERLALGDRIFDAFEENDFTSDGYRIDGYSMDLRRGEVVRIDVIGSTLENGSTLDTRLIVISEDGDFLSNDDAPSEVGLPSSLDSSLTYESVSGGTIEIYTTTFFPNVLGDYELVIGTPES